jgi:hypothetical protein
MDNEKIIEAIRKATNGEFVGDCCMSTLMGWINQYDEQGRLLTADPNYRDSEVNINGATYKITRNGWYAYIWNPKYEKACYTWCWMPNRSEYLIGEVDLRPDYVKEWQEKQKKEK